MMDRSLLDGCLGPIQNFIFKQHRSHFAHRVLVDSERQQFKVRTFTQNILQVRQIIDVARVSKVGELCKLVEAADEIAVSRIL